MIERTLWNYYLRSHSYFRRDTRCLGYPKVYTVELTNRCAMSCKMCPRKEMTRPLGDMSLETFQRVVDQSKPYANRYLCIHGIGDSLLHPELDRFIAYASEKGYRATTSTNPSSLTKRACEKILDSGLYRLIISLDGTDAETYRRIRGPKADYDKAVANIHRFLDMKRSRGGGLPNVELSLIRMRETEEDVETFRKQWTIPGVESVFIKTFKTWDGSQQDIIDLAGESQYSDAFQAKTPHPCIRPWVIVSVLWDGRVVPCCYDFDAKVVLGNINDQSIKEIWNAEPMKKLRQGLMEGGLDEGHLCRTCREGEGFPASRYYPFDLPLTLNRIGPARLWAFMMREGN